MPALVNSGLPNDKFVFEGFLPVKKGRQTRFLLLAEEPRTIILYESPHKLIKTLSHICEYFGEDRQISVSRELTKLYEETQRGTAKSILEHYTNRPPKGEIVIVVAGKSKVFLGLLSINLFIFFKYHSLKTSTSTPVSKL